MTARAVVLARGLGRRMQEADERASMTAEQRRAADAGAKAMMPVGGRPFLDFVLSAIADAGFSDVALVVAPDHGVIRRHFIEAPPERLRLDFVVQEGASGTADAIVAAEAWCGGASFVAMNADNLYPVEALGALARLDEPGLAVFARDDLVRSSNIPPERVQAFALLDIDEGGYLAGIDEKPDAARVEAAGPHAAVSMNLWRFDRRIFGACRQVPPSARGEHELPHAVALAIAAGVRFRAVPARGPVLDLSRRSDAAEVSRRLAGVVPRP